MNEVDEQLDELRLVAVILDTLSNTEQGLRPDQVVPLTVRIRRAVDIIETACAGRKPNLSKNSGEKDRFKRADGLPKLTPQVRKSLISCSLTLPQKPTVTKPSSISVFPVPREKPPQGQLAVSKEVSRCLACSLYNILEGSTRLLKATSAHIFVRKDDEMVSIANCAARLTFPPELVRHKCLGSLDADVLASGIALNQQISDGSKTNSSLLIFPVFASDQNSQMAVAVVHVENKFSGSVPFNNEDEGILLTTARLIGGLMSRFPQMDWRTKFYDPVTQHILAPFVPRKRIPMTREKTSFGQQAFITETSTDADHSDVMYWRKIEECEFPRLIRRETLPRLDSQKPLAQGLSTTSSLREVGAYIENMHSCWKRSISSNVRFSEEERSNQIELKVLRRELTRVKVLYAELEEKLRLYQLEGREYEEEFRVIKGEIDSYLRRRDNLDVK
ncbi:hypothetical protein C3747_7g133 [Trypanosoma cruzi]|uniref:Uncharacterized protein n=2 Tax=Trypanosoma cruzi TaxID=5693 RepID=Q4CTM4_TRYCC|nr:hypothetical protein, conserved [Trypanosoma cruzi]EAN83624.1 hypothetical protein, conserved [Trypanosoma cruzi]KAF5222986.1 hypothetical protein ECC02_003813 [Trypanosoma cruzi]PWV20182.1 hypothetical protein C3747_7g133 [Trypanosoma cruzi]RNC60283.1 hypothetical protein TcCL_ESM02071 [Trypanosoma cruzi]|eukprot:XP_805475.1 hypothetical protein [Trypanosoma cruzi strain CL Brener]